MIIFDGTARIGEALCIVVRFIDSEWSNSGTFDMI